MLVGTPLPVNLSVVDALGPALWIRRVLVRSQEGQLEARLARRLKERYPDGREAGDGRYLVTFKVADAAWFVREVLQYGRRRKCWSRRG